VIKYLQGTIDLTLALSREASGYIKWWTDASFAIPTDMKGQEWKNFKQQKLVTRSLMDSNVMAARSIFAPKTVLNQVAGCI
jgi:hypothetical protein